MEEQVVPTEVAEEKVEETVVETTPKEEPQGEVPVEEPPLIIPPPKKKTAQERIDEITRARREAEREAEFWRQKALGTTPEKPPQPPRGANRPVISNYDTTEAYEDALLEWHDNERKEIARVDVIKKRNEDAVSKYNERAATLRNTYEDFDEVVEAPVFTPAMRAALLQSENGPELSYFLGKAENRAAAERINRLPVEMQLYELGKLEERLLMVKKTRRVPSAPPPITPIGAKGGGEADPSKMSIEEWMKWDRDRQMERYQKKYGG